MYTAKTFTLPTIEGLSQKQVDVHLALYQGYVKHVNLIQDTIKELRDADAAKHAYTINELRRRFAFEFDGMRMHELYFEQLEGGASAAGEKLTTLATAKYGSVDGMLAHIREVAGTRGIGWVVVYYDDVVNTLHTTFVADHELGQLSNLKIVYALDLWEHAFMVDYVPADKKNYVDVILAHTNWFSLESRLP